MYYVSVKDIVDCDLASTNISQEELKEITQAVATGGVEGLAEYLNKENTPLRDYILTACGMNVNHRITIDKCCHRTQNGEGKEIYDGTRWIGRSLSGESIHEVMQDLATDEKYIGMGKEIGQNLRPVNKRFLKQNPQERLSIRKASEMTGSEE